MARSRSFLIDILKPTNPVPCQEPGKFSPLGHYGSDCGCCREPKGRNNVAAPT
jgi:hypothetical protein